MPKGESSRLKGVAVIAKDIQIHTYIHTYTHTHIHTPTYKHTAELR